MNIHKKIRVAVLMGGPSAEHDVSLKTGRMILKHLDASRYATFPVVISRTGHWPITIAALKNRCDVAFIAMHGEYGEDGQLQKILEEHKICFTGSGSTASALGMDKRAAEKVFVHAGLRLPPLPTALPMVIKPADRGSSVGVSIVRTTKELPAAITTALQASPNILFQQFITGRELTCGVLEIDGKPMPLPPTEIIPVASKFFDFKAKYQAGGSREISPPNLPIATIKKIQRIALTAHCAIGARGMSRTDMILDRRGRFYVLEINTIPGMTAASLLPGEAKAAGIAFSEVLDIIIAAALRKTR